MPHVLALDDEQVRSPRMHLDIAIRGHQGGHSHHMVAVVLFEHILILILDLDLGDTPVAAGFETYGDSMIYRM